MYYGYRVFENGVIFGKKSGKPLKPHLNNRGYLQVRLTINGEGITKKVHRLVAEVFLPNYYRLPTVDHKDRNKLNNSLFNLKWEDRRGQGVNKGIQSNNTSGFKGVTFHKGGGKWQASISKQSNKQTFKSFHTIEEAIEQRLAWEDEYY